MQDNSGILVAFTISSRSDSILVSRVRCTSHHLSLTYCSITPLFRVPLIICSRATMDFVLDMPFAGGMYSGSVDAVLKFPHGLGLLAIGQEGAFSIFIGSFAFGSMSGPGYFLSPVSIGIGRFEFLSSGAHGASQTVRSDGSTTREYFQSDRMVGPSEVRHADGRVVLGSYKDGVFVPKQLDSDASSAKDETQRAMEIRAFDSMFSPPLVVLSHCHPEGLKALNAEIDIMLVHFERELMPALVRVLKEAKRASATSGLVPMLGDARHSPAAFSTGDDSKTSAAASSASSSAGSSPNKASDPSTDEVVDSVACALDASALLEDATTSPTPTKTAEAPKSVTALLLKLFWGEGFKKQLRPLLDYLSGSMLS